MKVGDLIKRKYMSIAQRRRMMAMSSNFYPETIYIVVKINEDIGARIYNPLTDGYETIPNSRDYYEIVSDNK